MKIESKCLFKLRHKYNGIQLGHSGRPIRNDEITNEIGLELLEKHPRGALLFEKMPSEEEIEQLKDADDSNSKLTFSELKEKYPNIKARSKEKFLLKIKEL